MICRIDSLICWRLPKLSMPRCCGSNRTPARSLWSMPLWRPHDDASRVSTCFASQGVTRSWKAAARSESSAPLPSRTSCVRGPRSLIPSCRKQTWLKLWKPGVPTHGHARYSRAGACHRPFGRHKLMIARTTDGAGVCVSRPSSAWWPRGTCGSIRIAHCTPGEGPRQWWPSVPRSCGCGG